MTKQLWINLPVKNVALSKAFFTQIGFSFNPHYAESDESACLVVGEENKVVVMLFDEATFKNITQSNLADTKQTAEVLFSFDAESKEEVDAMAEKVRLAGGNVFSKPASVAGWMYGCAFTDLDGHRWNILHMDTSKMPR